MQQKTTQKLVWRKPPTSLQRLRQEYYNSRHRNILLILRRMLLLHSMEYVSLTQNSRRHQKWRTPSQPVSFRPPIDCLAGDLLKLRLSPPKHAEHTTPEKRAATPRRTTRARAPETVEQQAIRGYVQDLRQRFQDFAGENSSVTRAYHLYQKAHASHPDLDISDFTGYLEQAAAITAERGGELRYLFSVVTSLIWPQEHRALETPAATRRHAGARRSADRSFAWFPCGRNRPRRRAQNRARMTLRRRLCSPVDQLDVSAPTPPESPPRGQESRVSLMRRGDHDSLDSGAVRGTELLSSLPACPEPGRHATRQRAPARTPGCPSRH